MDHCRVQPKEANGYYLNKIDDTYSATYVVCDNKRCETKARAGLKNVCTDDKYKIIEEQGTHNYQYCESSTSGVDLDDGYKVNIDNFAPMKKFNYPTELGDQVSRDVLFKFTEFSVIALNGDSLPIGYIKVGNDYIECKFDDEVGKVCETAEIEEACTTEVAGKLFDDQGTVKLCIDSSDTTNGIVDLSSATGEYILPLGSGLFGISSRTDGAYYITVEIEDEHVKLKKELAYIKSKYTDYDTTNNKTLYKIFSKGEAEGTSLTADSICTTGSARPFEFVLKVFGVGSNANPKVDYYTPGENYDLTA